MNVHPPETAITVQLPFREPGGSVVVPTALAYRILDESGSEVLASTAITSFDPAQGEVEVTISGAQNALGTGLVSGFRRVELTMITLAGAFTVSRDYILEARSFLVVGQNSLVTYEQGILLARQLGLLPGWDAANESMRKQALLRAYDQLSSLTFRFEFTDSKRCGLWNTLGYFTDLPALEAVLPSQLAAMQRAQVIQADFLLGGNPIEKNINDGLQSTTIGEVSQFYRPRPSMNSILCRAALQYVSRYMSCSLVIGRA